MLTFMVRNLRMLNIFLLRPKRFCLKKMGPGSVMRMRKEMRSMGMSKKIIAREERMRSSRRLKKDLYIFCLLREFVGGDEFGGEGFDVFTVFLGGGDEGVEIF